VNACPAAPQGRSAALKLAMARPTAAAAAPALQNGAETAASVDAGSLDGGQKQGAQAHAASDKRSPPVPAADDLGLAPGLPVMQDPPGSGASGSLLELLLSDEEPPLAADAAALTDVATVPCADAESPPPQVCCFVLPSTDSRTPAPSWLRHCTQLSPGTGTLMSETWTSLTSTLSITTRRETVTA
jgi:hypothetical protein